MRSLIRLVAVILLLGATAGCAVGGVGVGSRQQPTGGPGLDLDLPTDDLKRKITPRAVGALTAQNLARSALVPQHGTATSRPENRDLVGPSGVGARMIFEGGQGDRVDLRVYVGPQGPAGVPATCASLGDTCAEVDGGLLLWGDAVPGDAEAAYAVVMEKKEGWVVLVDGGEPLDADPRTAEPSLPVDAAVALVLDGSLDARTTKLWLVAGRRLAWWDDRGGTRGLDGDG